MVLPLLLNTHFILTVNLHEERLLLGRHKSTESFYTEKTIYGKSEETLLEQELNLTWTIPSPGGV